MVCVGGRPYLEDFNALASSLALSVAGVRGCLILSRDGLVLGSHPSEAEARTTPPWLRFAALGDPERGFAQFPGETWCYVRRGPYAAFAVVGMTTRPGLVIDQMDQALLAAEQARYKREGLRGAETPPAAPTSKPRAPLHVDLRAADEPAVVPSQGMPVADPFVPPPAQAADGGGGSGGEGPEQGGEHPPHGDERDSDPFEHESGSGASEHESGPEASEASDDAVQDGGGPPEAETVPEHPLWPQGGEDDDVDRFSLAREFGQLLQHEEDAADG